MSKDCKYYDSELDCCKLLSDWSEAMPVLQPCVDGPCDKHQLAEMEADLERCIVFDEYLAKEFGISNANYVSTAEKLYNLGWRKQIEGEWIEQSDGTHYCSNCGRDATYTYDGREVCGVACPHCGTRMRGVRV